MITRFLSQADRRALQALASFISEMRSGNPYSDVDWESATWDVGAARRASARVNERIHFTCHRSSGQAGRDVGDPFPPEFGGLVRAVIVSRAINARERPTALSQMVLIRAFRYLFDAMGPGASPISLRSMPFRNAFQAPQGP